MPAESPGEAFDTAVLVGKGKVRYGCLGVNKVIRALQSLRLVIYSLREQPNTRKTSGAGGIRICMQN